MKVAVTGIGFFTIFILTISIIMSLGKDNREYSKLTESVEVAVYQSLQEGILRKVDPGEVFDVNLQVLLSDEDYTFTIIESDLNKGILSVSVELFYTNMGKSRSVEVMRTVIYEQES